MALWIELDFMYAVIETGGKQYRVEPGAKVEVEKLPVDAGDEVTFDQVLMLVDGDDITVGVPRIENAKVTASVVKQKKDNKVLIYKMRRRKGYRLTKGHRQRKTVVEIKEIAK